MIKEAPRRTRSSKLPSLVLASNAPTKYGLRLHSIRTNRFNQFVKQPRQARASAPVASSLAHHRAELGHFVRPVLVPLGNRHGKTIGPILVADRTGHVAVFTCSALQAHPVLVALPGKPPHETIGIRHHCLGIVHGPYVGNAVLVQTEKVVQGVQCPFGRPHLPHAARGWVVHRG